MARELRFSIIGRKPTRQREDWQHIERLALRSRQLSIWSLTSCIDKALSLLAIWIQHSRTPVRFELYDLLASEARLTSFVTIAQGQLPQENWFALGRLLTTGRRRSDPSFVGRVDVRVSNAAAGDADLREHAARPDLQSGGG